MKPQMKPPKNRGPSHRSPMIDQKDFGETETCQHSLRKFELKTLQWAQPHQLCSERYLWLVTASASSQVCLWPSWGWPGKCFVLNWLKELFSFFKYEKTHNTEVIWKPKFNSFEWKKNHKVTLYYTVRENRYHILGWITIFMSHPNRHKLISATVELKVGLHHQYQEDLS